MSTLAYINLCVDSMYTQYPLVDESMSRHAEHCNQGSIADEADSKVRKPTLR